MKFVKWKSFFITGVVCIFPILLGISLWDKLPDRMAIHFDFYGKPDNFASKSAVVFGLPVFMALIQGLCCVISDWDAYKRGERKKLDIVTKWITPFMSVVLQIATLGYGLGWQLDIRKVVAFVIGVIFVVTGNYLPKLDTINRYNVDSEKARKINRFVGYETVVMGILFLADIFMPPVCTGISIVLLIPYTVVAIIYGIKVGKA